MKDREILGHIDCPCCGAAMRITPDRNGDPFGYCEDGCQAQLRVGGKPARVRAFYAAHPGVKRPGQADPVPAPAPAAAAPAPVTVTEAAPPPAPKKRASAFDYLLTGGRA